MWKRKLKEVIQKAFLIFWLSWDVPFCNFDIFCGILLVTEQERYFFPKIVIYAIFSIEILALLTFLAFLGFDQKSKKKKTFKHFLDVFYVVDFYLIWLDSNLVFMCHVLSKVKWYSLSLPLPPYNSQWPSFSKKYIY